MTRARPYSVADELDSATRELVDLATGLARRRNIAMRGVPELLLLAAIETAAQIDGTANGTIEWLEQVAARLRETCSEP